MWAAATIIAIGGALLYGHAQHYMPFLCDDAFISLRYAKRLVDGQGLTWSDGIPVEGYSNLLLVLLEALLGFLGVDYVLAVRLLCWGATVLTMIALCIDALCHGRRPILQASVTVLVFVGTGVTAIWSIGGLEHPLLTALFVPAFSLVHSAPSWPASGCRSRLAVASVLAALLAWTRPDALLAVAVLVLAAAHSQHTWAEKGRAVLCFAAGPAAAVLAQLAFRLAYYGDWVPNTAHVKVAMSTKSLVVGWMYVSEALRHIGLLVAAAVAGLCSNLACGGRASRRALHAFAFVVLWLTYVVFIGGDHFPGWRHLFPVIPMLALLCGDAVAFVADALRRTSHAAQGAWVLLGIFFGALHGVWQFREGPNIGAKNETWEWIGKESGLLLKDAFGAQDPLMAIEPAGVVPFFSEFRAIDMLGLSDYHIARLPHRNARPGHSQGDGAYVLRRQPDLMYFVIPPGHANPAFLSGHDLMRMPEFHDNYQLLQLKRRLQDEVVHTVRLRRMSPRLGIRAEGRRVVLPAQLFGQPGLGMTFLRAPGRLATEVAPQGRGWVRRVPLQRGQWRVRVDGDGVDPAMLRLVAPQPDAPLRVSADARSVVVLAPEAQVDIAVHNTTSSAVVLVKVVLEQQPKPPG
ncbi:MAG: hypothetical protein ACPGUV_03180 [Polyangiales bacterium]